MVVNNTCRLFVLAFFFFLERERGESACVRVHVVLVAARVVHKAGPPPSFSAAALISQRQLPVVNCGGYLCQGLLSLCLCSWMCAGIACISAHALLGAKMLLRKSLFSALEVRGIQP